MPKMKQLIVAWLLAIAFATMEVSANTTDSLSFYAPQKPDTTTEKPQKSCWLKARAIVGAPLLVGGLLGTTFDSDIRDTRSGHLAQKNGGADNYLRFAPAAVMLSLKAAGVESRSSWSRMLTSDALSAAIVVGTVKGIKHTAGVERPDASDNKSFPSGHTALAFATATMLYEEYGHLSPWVGFGSYALAATTGAMRVAGHHHWASDVLTGAGIGVVATELGYLLGDLIFKDKGIRPRELQETFSREDHPSFIALSVGHQLAFSHYRLQSATSFPQKGGTTAALEGAYFLNPYIGIGGRFKTTETYVCGADENGEESLFCTYAVGAGAYFSYPLTARWLLGSKLLVGGKHYPKLNLTGETVASRNAFNLGAGLSVAYRCREHYALRLFMDYDLSTPHAKKSDRMLHSLGTGLSFELTL